MPDQENVYTYFPVFRRTAGWTQLAPEAKARAAGELEKVLAAAAPGVEVRATYSVAGFRSDADLMFWWVSRSPDALQDLLTAVRRTAAGRCLELSWAFLGLSRPAEFAPDHVPAFVRGAPPLRYVCVYPFVRTTDWYLLSDEERASLLREHGRLGRDYPEVQSNTTQAFGLGDYEWILAFEADELHLFVDMIRHLRAAAARRYTKLETPFVTGIRKEVGQALADLG